MKTEKETSELPTEHDGFFKPTRLCLWCGKPIMLDENAATWIHTWDRWKGDNGYYCFEGGNMSANGRTQAEQNMVDDGWVIHSWRDGIEYVFNWNTKQEKPFEELEKEYNRFL